MSFERTRERSAAKWLRQWALKPKQRRNINESNESTFSFVCGSQGEDYVDQ